MTRKVDVAFGAKAVPNALRGVFVELPIIGETLDQVWVADVGAAKGDEISEPIGNGCFGLIAIVAAIGHQATVVHFSDVFQRDGVPKFMESKRESIENVQPRETGLAELLCNVQECFAKIG